MSILFISLLFSVFLGNNRGENVDLIDNTNQNYFDDVLNPKISSSSWYDLSWKYRSIVNISTGSAAVSSGYTVSLTFDHASLVNMKKSRIDGNDIRLVYLDGSNWEEIDRMLDPGSSWNNDSTKIWFKLQKDISASSYDSKYYLYYGNKLAESPPHNSTNVFLFYDGFESGNFNLWDDNATATGDSITVSSNRIHTGNYAAKAEVDNQNDAQAIVWKDFSGYTSLSAKIHIYLDPSFSTSGHVTVMQFIDISAGWQNILSATINNDTTLYMWNDYVKEAYGYLATNTISIGGWHVLEMQATFSETIGEARLWLDGNLEIEETSLNLTDSSSIRFCNGYYWGDPKDEPNILYIDNTYLRPYINPEPVSTLDTEEMFRPSINDFTYYKEITIDHTKVSGASNLINFPVLISILDADLHDHAQADGDDVAFYNGTDWLDHEIEEFKQSYSTTHAQLVAWVRIPNLSSSVDTTITMYYGNSTIGSQENPSGVWNSNFGGVWHLGETPSDGALGSIEDSSTNGNDGTPQNFEDGGGGSTNAIGKIDGAVNCSGDDDYITISNPTNTDPTDELTISAWINAGTSLSHHGEIVSRGDSYAIRVWTNGRILFSKYDGISNWINMAPDTVDVLDNNFHYVVAGQNASGMFLFIDGVEKDANGDIDPFFYTLGKTLEIGRHGNDDGGYNFTGILDEVRMSNIGHSVGWIATEYNNQYDPSSFYSIGVEKTKLARNVNYFNYYKIITINHTNVSGSNNLINFPILISTLDSDLHDHTQQDGDDIAFYNGTDWLDHEIELFNQSYSATHAQLVAWVRIPTLSPSGDTNITMYYGNATMSSQENPTGVWDPNFIGVWHLTESGSGMVNEYFDSSHYGNHGQGGAGNTSYIPNQATGPIGFGQNFTDHFIDCGNDTSIAITGNQITMQLWMKYPSTHPWMGPFNHKGFYEGYRLTMSPDSQYLRAQLPGDESDLQTSQIIPTDIWHHVVVTYNGSIIRIFVDGVPDPANLSKMNNLVSALPNPFRIGHGDQPEGQAWTYPWLGQIDEVRISNVGRSADWIVTEYNNQYNPSSFYTIGIEHQLGEDTSPPVITINSPNPYELFGISSPDYNLMVTDANLDSIWYSLDGGANSTPVSAIGTIDQTMWSLRPNGTVTIRFSANDTLGNLNYKEVTVRKDIINPLITINNPIEDDQFGIDAPAYNLTVTDANLDSIWYSLDGGANSTPVSAIDIIDQTMWSLRPNGSVTIQFYANDTVSNINFTEVIVWKDIIEPSISINSPSASDLFGLNAPNYNLTVVDVNLDSIWYSLDGGANSTPVSAIGTIDQTMWSLRPNGTVTIRFYANDTLGNLNFTEIIVIKDILEPMLSITAPNNYELFGIMPPNITLSVFDGNLDDVWYQLENASVTTSNYSWTGFILQGIWDQVGNGTVTIKFYANDTIGNLANTEIIVYKDIYVPIITVLIPSSDEVFNTSAPNFVISKSGSNLNSTWYTLDDGVVNYTFTGLTGIINQSAWITQGDGTVTLRFYINNSLNVIGFDEITVIKDTNAPQITINLPLNNTYCGVVPIINVLVIDANLDAIWYEINTNIVSLTNNMNQRLEASIWSGLLEGEFYIYIYANDSARNLSDPIILRLYKDTIAPSPPSLTRYPQGEVSGNLLFEWLEGSDPSGILKYRLIIDNEADPFATPGFVFDINVTGNSYEFTGTLQPGTYHFFLYQIDGAGHQSSAFTGNFIMKSTPSPSQPSEFPLWIIFVIIGAAVGGVVGVVVLKKSKGKKDVITPVLEKKLISKPTEEISEELTLLDYEILKVKGIDELNEREESLFAYIKKLEENKEYTKTAEYIGELILIEEILGNYQEAKLYRQKQIDVAVKGLEYLKDQYEVESKKAAVSGDYSKALELYNESKLISDNLKKYMENQESLDEKESATIETIETQIGGIDVEIVYACINDLMTKYFDDRGIKYYSNPWIYDDLQLQIHGLILTDDEQILDIDPSIKSNIKSIQIIYTENITNENITKLCQAFYNPYAVLIIVGIKWPKDIDSQTIETPPILGVEYQKHIRIIHFDLFTSMIGLEGAYETAFKEIIELYNKSNIDILQETHESSEIIIHSSDELRYDLKEKGLIKDKLDEFFSR